MAPWENSTDRCQQQGRQQEVASLQSREGEQVRPQLRASAELPAGRTRYLTVSKSHRQPGNWLQPWVHTTGTGQEEELLQSLFRFTELNNTMVNFYSCSSRWVPNPPDRDPLCYRASSSVAPKQPSPWGLQNQRVFFSFFFFPPGDKAVAWQQSQLWASLVHGTKGGFHNWQKHSGIEIGSSFGYTWHHLPGRRGWTIMLKIQPSHPHSFFFPNPHLLQFIFKPFGLLLRWISKNITTYPFHWNLICCCLSLPSLTSKQEANTTVSWEIFFFFLIKAALFDYQRIITLRIRPTIVCAGFHLKKNSVSMLFILASLWKRFTSVFISLSSFCFSSWEEKERTWTKREKKADTWPHYSCLRRGKCYDTVLLYLKRLVRWRKL